MGRRDMPQYRPEDPTMKESYRLFSCGRRPRGRRSWRSSFLGDPGSQFLSENWERQEERKGAYKKRKKIPTAELNRRDQVTATNSWPNFPSREGNRGR